MSGLRERELHQGIPWFHARASRKCRRVCSNTKCGRALSAPHSVSMCDYYINFGADLYLEQSYLMVETPHLDEK
jgi:hypothetical protein